MILPFQPHHAATVLIDVSASSQRIQVTTHKRLPVRIFNGGTATAFIEFGDSTVAASLTTSMPVGPGVTEVVTGSIVHPGSGDPLFVAAIAVGSTGKIYFTPGDGV